jgi:hypothetical protein
MTFWESPLDRIAVFYESLINRDGPNPWKAIFYIICLALLKNILIISPLLLLIASFSIAMEIIIQHALNFTVNFIIGLLIYHSLIKIYYCDVIQFITKPVPEKKYISLVLSIAILSAVGGIFSGLINIGIILIYSFILIGIKTFSTI